MKTKPQLLCAVLIVLATTVHAQTRMAPADWQRYTVKGEEFSVMLPHLPAMTSTKTSVARVQNGQPVARKRTERVLVASADGVTYTVYAYENPKPRQTLDEFIAEQNAKSTTGTAQSGMEKFLATEDHFYKFVAAGASSDQVKVTQFFASIVLSKKAEGIEVIDGPGLPLQPEIVEQIYSGRDVTTKVRLLSSPEPVYTDAARKHKLNGVVVLKAAFSSNGIVSNFEIIQGLPDGLSEAAIQAARKIKFVPATKDGKNVAMWMQLEYNFNRE